MRTRSLLATLCLAPALAAAQAPLPTRPQRPVPPPTAPTGRPIPGPAVPPGAEPPATAAPPGAPAPGAARPPLPTAAVPRPAPGTPPPTPGAAPAAEASPPAPAAPPAATRSDSKCTPIQGRFLLAFTKADIADVLEQASRWSCRNFIFGEDVIKGKITLLSKNPVTAEEAYLAFLAALNSNGIALYQTGRYWKLVKTADAKKAPIPLVTTDGVEAPANEQPITKVIRLHYADADQVRGIIGNFISPQGADIQSIPPDTLIVTDFGLNLRRLERLIDTIDRAGSGEVVKLVQIRFAAAKDIADKVNQIYASGGPQKGRRTVSAAPARPPAPAPAPGAPAAEAAGGAVTVSISKVIPDDRTNKLIVIADEKSFERILELVQQLDVPAAEEGGIHVIYLKNAAAEDLATTLSNLAQGKSGKAAPAGGAAGALGQVRAAAAAGAAGAPAAGGISAELFTGEVKITADKAQNALVVQAGGADMVTVRRLVEKLDRPRRQVFVEAVIMEVDLQDGAQFGVGLHGVVPVQNKDGTGFIPIASSPGRINTVGQYANVQSVISLGGFLTGFSGPVSATLKDLGLNIPSLGIMVQALQSSSDVNIISTPHILASDNEESEITVGQTVPFQQGVPSTTSLAGLSGTGTQNLATALSGISTYIPVQRQPVELRLRLKPQISEGDNIRLQIDEQIEEITSTDAVLGPTTSKRTIKTQIVARDQSTIVIGGLIQERGVRSVKKVPFLGSLPILGWLFRDTQTTTTKTNLLLFLTPYIIRDEADYRRIYEKKRKEQQYFIEQFYGRRPGYEVAIDFARKSGPYAHLRRDVQEEGTRPENGGPGAPGDRVISAPGPSTDAAPAPQGAPPGPVLPGPVPPAPVPAAPPPAPGLPADEAAEPPARIPPEEAQPVPPVPEP